RTSSPGRCPGPILVVNDERSPLRRRLRVARFARASKLPRRAYTSGTSPARPRRPSRTSELPFSGTLRGWRARTPHPVRRIVVSILGVATMVASASRVNAQPPPAPAPVNAQPAPAQEAPRPDAPLSTDTSAPSVPGAAPAPEKQPGVAADEVAKGNDATRTVKEAPQTHEGR